MKIITFGCRVNAFESEAIKELIGSDLKDTIIVQTCAVTAEAERQCRQAVRQTIRQNPDKQIIVTGCAVQLHPNIFANIPGVSRVLGNYEKLDKKALLSDVKIQVRDLTTSVPIPPIINRFEGRNRAFLQIQQGCDHACTFCIVHVLRGSNQGFPPDTVIRQAQAFIEAGFSEIVLTGIDVMSYPYDLWGLTKRLLTEVNGLKRLRFGSLDPAGLSDDLLHLLDQYEALMPSFHLSVQAGDDLILKRMGRRHSFRNVLSFAQKLRRVRPLATIGADFIAGFPTETTDQFQRTLDLIQEAQITHAHIFPYSVRSGTPAARMPMVPKAERLCRAKQARLLGQQVYQKWLDKMDGKSVSILAEESGMGYTENYFPVRFLSPVPAGQMITGIIRKDKNELVF